MQARVGSRCERLQWKSRLKHEAKRMALRVRKPGEEDGRSSQLRGGGSPAGRAGGLQQSPSRGKATAAPNTHSPQAPRRRSSTLASYSVSSGCLLPYKISVPCGRKSPWACVSHFAAHQDRCMKCSSGKGLRAWPGATERQFQTLLCHLLAGDVG